MSVLLSPIGNGFQFLTTTGLPLNGGYIYTYQAGSTTPLTTYSDNSGSIPNANPIVLGTDGRPQNEIWLTQGFSYKFVLTDSSNNQIQTYDNLYGILQTAPAVSNTVPSGLIAIWSGSIGSIPSGWVLCNGQNGTPDLRNSFVLGAGNSYAVGATGGSSSISTGNLPSHTHTFSVSSSGSGTTSTGNANISDPGHNHQYFYDLINSIGTANSVAANSGISLYAPHTTATATTGITDSGHTHAFSVSVSGSGTTASTGSGTDFLPPYYALAFIMKT